MNDIVLQVPDAKSGNDNVDTVLVDEEAVGAPDAPGCGAKLLSLNRGSEQIPQKTELRDTSVCFLISCRWMGKYLILKLFQLMQKKYINAITFDLYYTPSTPFQLASFIISYLTYT